MYSIFMWWIRVQLTCGWECPICTDPFRQSRYSSPLSVNTYCRLALTTFKGSSTFGRFVSDSIIPIYVALKSLKVIVSHKNKKSGILAFLNLKSLVFLHLPIAILLWNLISWRNIPLSTEHLLKWLTKERGRKDNSWKALQLHLLEFVQLLVTGIPIQNCVRGQ